MCDLLLPYLPTEPNYNLSCNQLHAPQCRAESYSKSFLPSTIRAWNSVPDHLKSITFVAQFKSELKRYRNRISPPPYYNLGNRHTHT